MSDATRSKGVVVHLDHDGVVRDVLVDELGVAELDGAQVPFADVVDVSSAEKARHFLEAVRKEGCAVQWEMNIPMRGAGLERLECSGLLGEDGTVTVFAAATTAELLHLYEDIVAVNNQQATMLRRLMKERAQYKGSPSSDSARLEDISRLNSELVNAQRQLEAGNAQLRQAVAEKNRLLGIAAHDLRNPLGNIVSFCELLGEELKDVMTGDVRELLDIICATGTQALGLVEDMLDFSRIESGKLELELESTDVCALVERRIGVYGLSAERKGITLDTSFDEDMSEVLLDKGKFLQVVDNLLTNAIKYSNAGGSVQLSCAVRSGALELVVRDQGVGMSDKDQAGLFKPFFRGASQPTGREASNGLGLYIVKRIVDGHGGTISVSSAPGEGSAFTVRIPVDAGAERGD